MYRTERLSHQAHSALLEMRR